MRPNSPFAKLLAATGVDVTQNREERLNAGCLRVTRVDPMTRKTNSRDFPINELQWTQYLQGEYIQRALPHLTPDQREFILSGMVPESWDAMVADLEGDDD